MQLTDFRLGGSCWKDPVLSLFQAVVQLGCQSNLKGPDYKHCEMLSCCEAALLIRSCSKYLESSALLWDWVASPGCAHKILCPLCFVQFAAWLDAEQSRLDVPCVLCCRGPPGNGGSARATHLDDEQPSPGHVKAENRVVHPIRCCSTAADVFSGCPLYLFQAPSMGWKSTSWRMPLYHISDCLDKNLVVCQVFLAQSGLAMEQK